MGISVVPYQAESLAPLGFLTGLTGHLPGLLSLSILQKALPSRCRTTEISGGSHWHLHRLKQALPERSLAAVCAHSNDICVSLSDQSCPSSAAWSLLPTLPVRGPYRWGLLFFFCLFVFFFLFKLWKLKLLFQRYLFLLIGRFWQ